MKTVWVRVIPWDKQLVTAALESGADGVLVEAGRTAEVKALGIITTIAPDGDLRLGEDVVEVEIVDKAGEQKAARLAQDKTVIVRATDWTVIPLENIVAQAMNVIAEVTSAAEAETAVGILEVGTAGVLLNTRDPEEIRRTVQRVKSEAERVELCAAKVITVEPVGMGDRVCIDTCSNMALGEGMLVGSSSAAMVLVHSESVDNPYVEQRPFRVNAGPVHAYVRVPGGKTRYLSELCTGDPALTVNARGETRTAVIGRVKVERRPLALLRAQAGGDELATVLQNAETIRLVSPDGRPLSIVTLRPGDEVLVALERAGRHFGMRVEETIEER